MPFTAANVFEAKGNNFTPIFQSDIRLTPFSGNSSALDQNFSRSVSFGAMQGVSVAADITPALVDQYLYGTNSPYGKTYAITSANLTFSLASQPVITIPVSFGIDGSINNAYLVAGVIPAFNIADYAAGYTPQPANFGGLFYPLYNLQESFPAVPAFKTVAFDYPDVPAFSPEFYGDQPYRRFVRSSISIFSAIPSR